ncbi:hypothetical protein B0T25DRAFT_310976 [Lasiosphaeria hispida]|uniref:Myb-like DNA-binding domain-containing protein n=1 Tax=Lasiosphaeria hispida TaxID=260671 RepID=A0AAJ0H8S5_9PEZI|nr:hypothetical protein B0T25DRAFT_310976 [Lasiosphaeria hispida]
MVNPSRSERAARSVSPKATKTIQQAIDEEQARRAAMPAQNDGAAEGHVRFLLTCIRAASAGKVDFQVVANELGIVSKAAAAKRYERLQKQYPPLSDAGQAGAASGFPKAGPKTPSKKRKSNKITTDVDDDEPIKAEKVKKESKVTVKKDSETPVKREKRVKNEETPEEAGIKAKPELELTDYDYEDLNPFSSGSLPFHSTPAALSARDGTMATEIVEIVEIADDDDDDEGPCVVCKPEPMEPTGASGDGGSRFLLSSFSGGIPTGSLHAVSPPPVASVHHPYNYAATNMGFPPQPRTTSIPSNSATAGALSIADWVCPPREADLDHFCHEHHLAR